ncbi:MAG: hypothetical protein LBN00_06275 [Oscillospiraceae bacterium]|nr:hypothetical protein [Oscillospiraceae bacterium]
MRTLNFDLVYLEDFDLVDLYDRYQAAAEVLDDGLELFKFPYTTENAITGETVENFAFIRTYDRDWSIDLGALHYKFRVELEVSRELPPIPKMLEIQSLTETIKEEATDGAQ